MPKLTLSTDGEERDAYQLATYTARYFEIGGLSDELDPYALLSVTLKKGDGVSVSYYRPSECTGLLLTEAGQYTLRAYDRNGNSIKMTVNIPKEEKQYSLLEEDGGIRLALTDGAEVTAIYKNGEETEARELYFPATDTDEEYTVLLEKDGSRDVARFTVPAKRAVLPPAEGGENIAEGNAAWGGMSRDAMLVLVLAVALVSLAALSAVLIIIWRRRA